MKMHKEPFKQYPLVDSVKESKERMRADIKAATKEYLEAGNRITVIPDGPNAKVAALTIRELGWFAEERVFYEEASMGHLDADLTVTEDGEVGYL